jgi:hypothetical protein
MQTFFIDSAKEDYMSAKTSIHVNWNRAGRMDHQIAGAILPPPRNQTILWVLAPSVPLLLAHQFGVLKPSHALITCGRVMDMLFHNRYVLMPINSALKAVTIDFIYPGGPSFKLQFHPNHPPFANSDSLEEGVTQFINNYTHYAYSLLDEYTRIVVRTATSVAIGVYFDFLAEQISADVVGQGKDAWRPAFSYLSAQLISHISETYYVPEGGRNPENEDWAREQTDFLNKQCSELEGIQSSLLTAIGLQ